MYQCEQCKREMNPVDYIISHVCLSCTRKNHNAVIGIFNKKSERDKRDFINNCFEPKPQSFYRALK